MTSGSTLVVDNRDSFVWNLVMQLRELGDRPEVLPSHKVSETTLAAHRPGRILLSPGPGTPQDHPGTSLALEWARPRIPVLGVCLGLQVIGCSAGWPLERAPMATHGKTSLLEHDGEGIFAGLTSPLSVMRYHSLVLRPRVPQQNLVVTCSIREDGRNLVMGLRDTGRAIEGVQFHPDSFATESGIEMMRNFLSW